MAWRARRDVWLAIGLSWVASAGCQWTGFSPVSRSMVDCRQGSQQAITCMERGDWPQAEKLLAHAIESCPVDSDARRHYAEVLWQRGARAEALAQLAEAIRLSPDDARHRVRQSEMLLATGNSRGALDSAQRAVALDPNSSACWTSRARAAWQLGEARAALADCHRALAIEPESRELLWLSAELYRELGQPQRALANLQSLMETYPVGEEPPQALFLAGLAYAALGRYDNAIQSYQAARGRGRPDAELLFRLAEAQWHAGRTAQAAAAAREALALSPQHLPSRELLNHIAAVDAGGALR
jgi:tetratricopeptide (TPR) repeat protein